MLLHYLVMTSPCSWPVICGSSESVQSYVTGACDEDRMSTWTQLAGWYVGDWKVVESAGSTQCKVPTCTLLYVLAAWHPAHEDDVS